MAIEYNVYGNDLAGGPVDFTTPVATVSTLSHATAALPFGSDATYVVRARDTVSGLEEQNVTARFRIVTDGSGVDVTNRPAAPKAVKLETYGTGNIRARWHWPKGSPAPTQFKVYLGIGTVNYGTAVATVSYAARTESYSADLTGLTPGSAYLVSVRASNASGEEQNTLTASATPAAALTATPVGLGPATVGTTGFGADPDGSPSLP